MHMRMQIQMHMQIQDHSADDAVGHMGLVIIRSIGLEKKGLETYVLDISNRSANPCMNSYTTRRASATHSYHCCRSRRDQAASQQAGPVAVAAGRGGVTGGGVRGVENRPPGDTNFAGSILSCTALLAD